MSDQASPPGSLPPSEMPNLRDASISERQIRNAELREKAAKLYALKLQIDALRGEYDELRDEVKHYLKRGYRVTVEDRRVVLRPSVRRTVDFQKFLEVFGAKATQQCASIDLKEMDALARRGVLDREALEGVVQTVRGEPALYFEKEER